MCRFRLLLALGPENVCPHSSQSWWPKNKENLEFYLVLNTNYKNRSITTWTRGGGCLKMSVFVHAKGIKLSKNGKIQST